MVGTTLVYLTFVCLSWPHGIKLNKFLLSHISQNIVKLKFQLGNKLQIKIIDQWFSKVFATFLPFRTWVPSFLPSKKEYVDAVVDIQIQRPKARIFKN